MAGSANSQKVLLLVKLNELFSPPPVFNEVFTREGIESLALEPKADCAEDFVLKHGIDADGLMILVDMPVGTRRVLDGLKKCKAIVRIGAGMENVDIKAATEKGIMVANTPDALVDSVAEHALALYLCSLRRLMQHDRMLRKGKWNRSISSPMAGLTGQVCGLVGLGRIGQSLAKKVSALGLKTIGYDPYVSKETAEAVGVKLVSLDELLKKADVVMLHTALTPETRHLIGKRELEMMKESAILVNVARGAVVDEAELVVALKEGEIRAAALDVFEREPLSPESPLLELDNVVLTPHVGAYSDATLHNMYLVASGIMADYLRRGTIPKTILNPEFKPRVSPVKRYNGKCVNS